MSHHHHHHHHHGGSCCDHDHGHDHGHGHGGHHHHHGHSHGHGAHSHHHHHHHREEEDSETQMIKMMRKMGTQTTIINPYMPLAFERCNQYVDGVDSDLIQKTTTRWQEGSKCPELQQRAKAQSQNDKNMYTSYSNEDVQFLTELSKEASFEMCGPQSEIATLQTFGSSSDFLSEKIAEETKKVLMAYASLYSDPKGAIEVANHALSVTNGDCVEAYNILAIHASTFEEALTHYQRAQQSVHKLVSQPVRERAQNEGNMWGQPELRSYMRAMIGEANTLRKMRRNEEALQVYEKLLKWDREYTSFSSYVHYKVLIPELYMRLGKWREAVKFIKQHEQYLGRMSGISMYWNKALCDYVLDGGQDQWAESFFENSPMKGCILSAIIKAPLVYDYLTGVKKLAPVEISPVNGALPGDCPKNQQLCYVISNLDLWLNQPGAIEWAMKHYNTMVMLLWLRKEKEQIQTMNITEEKYYKCFEYFYTNAKVNTEGMTLLHETCMGDDVPKRVKAMLDAGASQKSSFSLTPLQMSCYYDRDPKTIALLIDAGGDPFSGEFSPIMMTCNQGNWRALKTILLKAPTQKITQGLLFNLFNALFSSSVYGCLKGDLKCQRCQSGSRPHSKYASFQNCVDLLVASGLKVNASQMENVRRGSQSWSFDLIAYSIDKLKNGAVVDHLVVDIDTTDLEKTNANMPIVGFTVGAKKKSCATCGKTDVKLMACSRCKKAFYCSKPCQVSGWKTHKLVCKQ